jgi:hypothetical protein
VQRGAVLDSGPERHHVLAVQLLVDVDFALHLCGGGWSGVCVNRKGVCVISWVVASPCVRAPLSAGHALLLQPPGATPHLLQLCGLQPVLVVALDNALLRRMCLVCLRAMATAAIAGAGRHE